MNSSLISLTCLGVGRLSSEIPDSIDWELIYDNATSQGVVGIVSDSIVYLKEHGLLVNGRALDKSTKKKWIASTFNFEQRYSRYRKAICELAAFYRSHGIKMMVLKGYGLSLNYPIPQHRPCGDIDIWLFGQYKEADRILSEKTGIQIDESHMHHTVFYWNNFMVENHFEMVNTQTSRSNARMEKLFQELAMDDGNRIEIDGETIYLPSPNFHLLFLLRHTMLHFCGEGIQIRHLLDWGFFVEKNRDRIDWEMINGVIEEYGMTSFFNCLNAICIEDLRFSQESLPSYVIDQGTKNKVLESILYTEKKQEMPTNLVQRLSYKFIRRRDRMWKHSLCYNESQMNLFLTSVWFHLRHPEII